MMPMQWFMQSLFYYISACKVVLWRALFGDGNCADALVLAFLFVRACYFSHSGIATF